MKGSEHTQISTKLDHKEVIYNFVKLHSKGFMILQVHFKHIEIIMHLLLQYTKILLKLHK